MHDLEIDGVTTRSPHANMAVVELTNVEDAFIYDCSPKVGTDVFLKLNGEQTQNITVSGNNFRHVKTPILKDGKLEINRHCDTKFVLPRNEESSAEKAIY